MNTIRSAVLSLLMYSFVASSALAGDREPLLESRFSLTQRLTTRVGLRRRSSSQRISSTGSIPLPSSSATGPSISPPRRMRRCLKSIKRFFTN